MSYKCIKKTPGFTVGRIYNFAVFVGFIATTNDDSDPCKMTSSFLREFFREVEASPPPVTPEIAAPLTLTDDQIFIFGRPNVSRANVAKVLIAAGIYAEEPEKAGYEQAVYAHWASRLLSTYGGEWWSEADKIIKQLIL